MKRKIMLLAGSFIVLLVGFIGFHLVTGGGLGFHLNKPVTKDHPQTHAPTTLPKGSNWMAQQGTDVDIQDRDKAGRIRARYTWEDWSKQPDNSYLLQKPRVVLFQNNGQQIHILGREAVVVAEDMAKRPNIKRGKITGGVQIIYDTSKEVNRAPYLERLQDLVCIFVDELSLDNDRLMIYTDSPVKLYSQQIDVLGRGLLITWNEAPRELSLLRIDDGEKMTVYKVPEEMTLAPPGGMAASQPATAPALPAATGAKPTAPSKQTAAATSKRKSSKADRPGGETTKRQNIFLVEFDGSRQLVNVDYGASKMHNARTLTIEFQWDNVRSSAISSTRRSGPASEPAAGPSEIKREASQPRLPAMETLPASMPALAATRPMAPPKGEPMIVTWAGPLQIKPIAHIENPQPKAYKIVGLGEQLVLSDTQATATCKKFTFTTPDQKGELIGTEKDPALLAMADGQSISCARIQFDRTAGKAHMEGPGYFLRSSTRSSLTIENSGGFTPGSTHAPVFPLTPAPTPSPLSTTGERKTAHAPEITTDKITWTRQVNATFGQDPTVKDRKGKTREFIKDADFHGDVQLTQTPSGNFMYCQDLQVTLGKGSRNQPYPKLALARGKVHAKLQNANDPKRPGSSEIHAQNVNVTFEEVALAGAAKETAKVRPATLNAWGSVLVTDTSSSEPIAAQAETLDSNLLKRTAILVGAPARVSQGPDYILGETIRLDQINQSAAVSGKGKLRFTTKQDFSGNQLKQPQPVEIAWVKKMTYNGVQGFATFVGQVMLDSATQNQLETGADHMQCQQMDLWFEKVTPASAPAAPAVAARPDSQLGMGMERYSKQKIARLLLDRDVQVTSVRQVNDRLLRRLKVMGGKAEYDAKTTELSMPGAGTLLAEDYRPPEPAKKASTDPASPNNAKLERPWQSLFDWKTGMQFSQTNRTVMMEGDVTMVHRSGAQMVLIDKIKTLPMPKLGQGRDTSLTCDKLMAAFAPPDKARPAQSAPATKPANTGEWDVGPRLGALSRFSALTKVNFKDGPWQVLGDGLVYDKPDNKACVWSENNNNAYVFYERKEKNESKTWSSPRINIILKDGDIQSVQTENIKGGGSQ